MEEKQTLFDGGQAYLQRLDSILKYLDSITVEREKLSTVSEKLNAWSLNFAGLRVLYKELYPMIPEDKQEEVQDDWNLMERVYKECVRKTRKTGNVYHGFLKFFDIFENEMRLLASKKGLLMPTKKDKRRTN